MLKLSSISLSSFFPAYSLLFLLVVDCIQLSLKLQDCIKLISLLIVMWSSYIDNTLTTILTPSRFVYQAL